MTNKCICQNIKSEQITEQPKFITCEECIFPIETTWDGNDICTCKFNNGNNLSRDLWTNGCKNGIDKKSVIITCNNCTIKNCNRKYEESTYAIGDTKNTTTCPLIQAHLLSGEEMLQRLMIIESETDYGRCPGIDEGLFGDTCECCEDISCTISLYDQQNTYTWCECNKVKPLIKKIFIENATTTIQQLSIYENPS